MVNDRETLKQIKFHKDEAKRLAKQIKELEGEMAKHRRTAIELDEARSARLRRVRFEKDAKAMASKQAMIVNAIRAIDKVCTAGDICDWLDKKGLMKIHSSEFATKFGDAVLKDSRILVESVNPTFRRYSLKEWNWKRDKTKRAQKL